TPVQPGRWRSCGPRLASADTPGVTMSRTSLVVSAAVPIIIGLLSSGGAAQGRSSARATFLESDVLVQFRGDATFESRGNARGRVGGVRQDLVLAANRRND